MLVFFVDLNMNLRSERLIKCKFFFTLVFALILISCENVSPKRNPLKGTLIPGQEQIQAKDLSKLTPTEVIKTKFKSLKLICTYVIDASVVKDGAVTSEIKNGLYIWDIVANTVFAQNISLNDKVLNLNFNFTGSSTLVLDSKFSASVRTIDKYEIKTFTDDGKLLTNIVSDNSNNPITLHESDSTNIIEMSEGASGNTTGNKLKMDCGLKSDIYPIYK